MAPRETNPGARRNLSSWKRGYRHVTFLPDEWERLVKSVGSSMPGDIKRYLLSLHKTAQE